MTAPVPLCGACEFSLRSVQGKWVCLNSGCPLYGQEQPASPKSDKPQRDTEAAR